MIIYVVYHVVPPDDGTSPIVSLHLSHKEAENVVNKSVSILRIDEQTLGLDTYPNA